MAHYAEINEIGTVLRVIVAEADFVATMPGTGEPNADAVLDQMTCTWSEP